MRDAARLPASPALRARELVLLAAGAVLLAVAMFWPLVLHLGTDIPKDLGDPLPQAWQLAWGGHALTHQPLAFFQANQFWPTPDSLALSDALVGYAPIAWIGTGVTAAVARYDVVFLFASALAFAGAYLLARELGVKPTAAAVAGAAFAYAPWRIEQGGHLHIMSSGGIALSLFLLLRGYRRGSGRLVLAGWLAVSWQVAIGWSLGLPFLVALGAGAVVAAVLWWRRGRPALGGWSSPLVRATVAGLVAVAVVGVVLGRPYLRIESAQPQAQRTVTTVAHYSAGPKVFLASSTLSPLWGKASAGVRAGLGAVPEQTLFPGLVAVVLALLGLTWRRWPPGVRWGIGGATLAFAVLSMGFAQDGVGRYTPYRLLYEVVPGWSGMRVPERLNTFTSLGLALLAAGGAARLAIALTDRRHARLAVLVPVGLTALVLLEGAGFTPGHSYPHPTVPPAPAGQAGLDPPILNLPVAPQDNRQYLLWSTDGLQPMVNGRSSITPRQTKTILRAALGFPDAASVARLRRLGVRTVVLHTGDVGGSAWSQSAGRPVAGLGVRRSVRGPLVIYRLR